MEQKPRGEHEWLQQLIGEWTHETQFEPSPHLPPEMANEKPTGTESVHALGDLWVVLEGEGEQPGGGTAQTLMVLGFDPGEGRFVGSWVGSMMTYHWTYSGYLEEDGKTLTLEAVGPDMAEEGKTANYRDVIRITSDRERTLTGNVQDAEGNWTPMMTVTYRRT